MESTKETRTAVSKKTRILRIDKKILLLEKQIKDLKDLKEKEENEENP